MSTPPTCDGCERPIRDSQHELLLRDFTTGQILGRYHAATCQHSATEYFVPGMVTEVVYVHPDRCGENQEECDGGAFEVVA
jgi:hypothetical protein